MKLLKKLFTKLSGALKYLRYFGKIVQILRVLKDIIPQLAVLVPEENKKLLSDIGAALSTVSSSMDKTEVYLNSLGIETTTPGERSDSLEDNVMKLRSIASDLD